MDGKHLKSTEQYRIEDAPPSMYYIPDFITTDEEDYILNKIPPNRWISLSHRRLQAVPARLTEANALISSTGLSPWLINPVVQRINEYGVFSEAPHGINHCLINEYLPGQGIMAHEDGAAYYPVVATVSLGGTIVLDVTEKMDSDAAKANERRSWRIIQEPRSLLLTTGPAYKTTLHGIDSVEDDVDLDQSSVANWTLLGNSSLITANGGRNQRTARISLTYRDVLKVSKLGSKIFGKTKT